MTINNIYINDAHFLVCYIIKRSFSYSFITVELASVFLVPQ